MVTYQNRATWITRLWKKHFAKFFAPDLIATPFALVDEILDKLPIDWSNPALKFCDPCCGSGRFLMSLKYRLLAAGHTEKHIIENMLYGMDIDPVNTAGTVAMLGGSPYNHNIRTGNSLTEKWEMKFDVIVGNPPYQAIDRNGTRNNKKDNLWSQFVVLAFEQLSKAGSSVAMITPTSWMSPSTNKKGGSLLQKHFLTNQLKHLEVNTVGHYFPGVGSQFSWYVVQCVPAHKETSIRFKDVDGVIKSSTADLSGFMFLPPNLDSLTLSIFSKTTFSSTQPLPFIRSTEYATYNKKLVGKWSKVKTEIFKYQAFHTAVQDLYFSFNHSLAAVPKVYISFSGYSTPRLDLNGEYGVTECGMCCMVEPEVVYQVVGSKVYQFLLRTAKWSGFNSQWLITNGLPLVDLSRSWTDEELYAHFNLTADEIKLIEDTVK
jgi:hypothetical protein